MGNKVDKPTNLQHYNLGCQIKGLIGNTKYGTSTVKAFAADNNLRVDNDRDADMHRRFATCCPRELPVLADKMGLPWRVVSGLMQYFPTLPEQRRARYDPDLREALSARSRIVMDLMERGDAEGVRRLVATRFKSFK